MNLKGQLADLGGLGFLIELMSALPPKADIHQGETHVR